MLRGIKMENPEQELRGPEDAKKNKFTALRAIATVSAFLAPMALAAIIYMVVGGISLGGCGCAIPVGEFGDVDVVGPTSVNVDFGEISWHPRPMDLLVLLQRDPGTEGWYSFGNNGEGELILSSGQAVGTITYADLANNWKVDIGDQLRITNLDPDSNYIIRLYWVPTGDLITSTSFSTPP